MKRIEYIELVRHIGRMEGGGRLAHGGNSAISSSDLGPCVGLCVDGLRLAVLPSKGGRMKEILEAALAVIRSGKTDSVWLQGEVHLARCYDFMETSFFIQFDPAADENPNIQLVGFYKRSGDTMYEASKEEFDIEEAYNILLDDVTQTLERIEEHLKRG